jgi:hemerythrin-like domain-containing protein
MADPTERSVISALTRDHRHIQELLGRLRAATDPGERRRLLDEVATEIVQHEDAEEKYLYEVVRGAIPPGAIDIPKQIEAHVTIKAVLEELSRTDTAREEFDRLVSELSAEVDQNILNEENSVFTWLAQWVDERTLAELGDEIQALRT